MQDKPQLIKYYSEAFLSFTVLTKMEAKLYVPFGYNYERSRIASHSEEDLAHEFVRRGINI